jgi:phytoene dehydrogenase-like protein
MVPLAVGRTTSSVRGGISRRALLGGLLAAPLPLGSGCSWNSGRLPPAGEILGGGPGRGHRVRLRQSLPVPEDQRRRVAIAIVGGGVAGLAAAWRLRRTGHDDFVVIELEDEVGGTSRSGASPVTAYPWGAHYLPAPWADNEALVELLSEMGVVVGYDDRRNPLFAEEYLCRDPQERLFVQGRWQEDLWPHAELGEPSEWTRFRRTVDEWVSWRDGSGRRAFALPSKRASDAEEVAALDRISMDEWLNRNGFRSPNLRWAIDYACRDDYGATPAQVSAWAGLFYFAARIREPGADPQQLLTWPEGNGRLVAHLADGVRGQVRTNVVITELVPLSGPEEGVVVNGWDLRSNRPVGWRARHVIFAAPQFVAPHVIRGYEAARGRDVQEFQYGAWLVANLHLHDRPAEPSFPLSWDNVLFNSPGLGYVAATHQRGNDHGPTVFTYYRPLCADDPRTAREWLLGLSWPQCAELVLADLESAHPDLRRLIQRLDVMKWGHAMIRPTPGFRFGPARGRCEASFQGIHFAHSDLSGLALFEEAFDHGLRAADAVASTSG